MLNLPRHDGGNGEIPEDGGVSVVKGSTKFLVGTAVGGGLGFAIGTFAATSTARSAGHAVLGGLGLSGRFVGKNAVRAINGLGSTLKFAYTNIRGREAYLEYQIEELRGQITRLEQRLD